MKKKNELKKNLSNNLFLLKYIWKFAPEYLFWEVLNAVIQGSYIEIIKIYQKIYYDSLSAGRNFLFVLGMCILVFAVFVFVEIVTGYYMQVLRESKKQKLKLGMTLDLFHAAQRVDLACYDDTGFYDDFIWSMNNGDNRAIAMVDSLMKILNRFIVLITSSAIMVTINPWVALIAAFVSVISLILNRNLMLLSVKRKVALNSLTRKSAYYERIFSLPNMAKEIRISHVSDVILDDYEKNIEEICKTEQRCNKESVKYSLPSTLLESLLQPVVYMVVLYLIMVKKSASIGDLAIVVSTFSSIKLCLSDLLQSLTSFEEHSLFIEKVRTLLEYKPKLKNGELPVPNFETFEMKNVCFSYPNGEEVLHDINLKVRRGERIAIVGYNGAGKSTLIKLMLRFYEPISGVILLNGTDIREYDLEAYRHSIGSVFQDFQIYALSLSANVLCDEVSEADADIVFNALRAASFTERLEQMSDGLKTELTREFSDDGINLSGGEAQKIAISRIFARPYQFILMDEPSASLDPEAENEINTNISRLGLSKTVVCISHRLSTTRYSDRIYVLDGGHLAEEGTHQQLMSLGGRYAEMFKAQAKKYTVAETCKYTSDRICNE